MPRGYREFFLSFYVLHCLGKLLGAIKRECREFCCVGNSVALDHLILLFVTKRSPRFLKVSDEESENET